METLIALLLVGAAAWWFFRAGNLHFSAPLPTSAPGKAQDAGREFHIV